MRLSAAGLASGLVLAASPALADVTYDFIATSSNIPAPMAQTFVVTDEARAFGSLNVDTWCGAAGLSVCQATALAAGWVSGFQWPSVYSLGEASLVFDGELASGSIAVQLADDVVLTYQGGGTAWTAAITDAGQPWYNATGYFLDPVPEPSALSLVLGALLGLGLLRRYV